MARAGGERRSRDRVVRVAGGAGLVLAIGLAAADLSAQASVAASRTAAEEQTGQLMRGNVAALKLPSMPIEGPPEARVLDALRTARVANTLPPGARRAALIAEAVRAATQTADARPDWGEAQVVVAYAASLGHSRADGARARAALAASYADAPLLHDAGQWRIRYGTQAWPVLGAATREAILREGIWLLGVDQSRWPLVFGAFRGSPAYVPFMLRWRMVLSGTYPADPSRSDPVASLTAAPDAERLAETQPDQRQE